MENVVEVPPQSDGDDQQKLNKAAYARHLQKSGQDLESLRLGLDTLKDKQQFVYKLEFRAPSVKSAEWLLLAKLLSPEGPRISFTNGGTFVSAMNNMGRRMRGGALEWHEDGYPPEDWMDRLAYMYKNQTWLNF